MTTYYIYGLLNEHKETTGETIMKESDLQRKIIKHYEDRHFYVLRLNSGSITLQSKTGSRNVIKLCKAGTPDVVIMKDGLVIFIEVKKDASCKPTSVQLEEHKRIKKLTGFHTFVVNPDNWKDTAIRIDEMLTHHKLFFNLTHAIEDKVPDNLPE